MKKTERNVGPYCLISKSFEPYENRDWHSHDCAAITLTTAGTCWEDFGNIQHACADWRIHFKPADAIHRTSSSKHSADIFVIGVVQQDLADPNDILGTPRLFDCGIATALAIQIFSQPGNPTMAQIQKVRQLIDSLLGRLSTFGRSPSTGGRPNWVTEAHSMIEDLQPGVMSASKLAEIFRVHPAYLARVFRNCYGQSISEKLNASRITRAIQMLLKTDISLTSLAVDLGYHDQSHFCRYFRKATGTTPAKLRRLARDLKTA